MKGRNSLILWLFLIFLSQTLYAQDEGTALSRGFRELRLGLSLEEAKNKLLADPWFLFRGDPDVSLLSTPNESLIDCEGASFIQRGLFQFDEKKLFIISLILDADRLDFYTMFTSLQAKYGPFQSLNPQMVIWDDGTTRISLERPLTIKYIDLEVFNRKRQEAVRGDNLDELSRQNFIELF